MQHTVDVYRDPTGTYGTRGEILGGAELVAARVPCSIETLSGREAEQARSTYPYAAYQVEFWGSPAWNLTTQCKLIHGNNVYHIGHIDDVDQKGCEFVLLCGRDLTEVANG